MKSFFYQFCSNFSRKLMIKQSMRYSWKCWITTSNGANTCGNGWLGIGCSSNLETVQFFFSLLRLKYFLIYFTRLILILCPAVWKQLIGIGSCFWFHYTFSYGVKLQMSVFFLSVFAIYSTMWVCSSSPLMLFNLYHLLCALIGHNTEKDFMSSW